MNGCHSTIGQTWQRFKTLQRSGCGLTTMTARIWPWAGSHPSSGWPWLPNVSTSATPSKGGDYRQGQLKSKPPIRAMKDWYASHSHLFVKGPYDHPGCDN
jgi:hypothetical protein